MTGCLLARDNLKSADMLLGHRLSTYPFLHLGIFHTVVNIIALTPLLEKFEAENGTLVTTILFTGRTLSY